jgi:hypothetical protein
LLTRVVLTGSMMISKGMRKALAYGSIVVCLFLIAGGVALEQYARSLGPRARDRIIRALQDRFDADVQLRSVNLSIFPKPTVIAEGLTLRHKRWTDPEPLIYIRRFTAQTDFSTVIDRRNHVGFVRLEGLAIHIPPRGHAAEAASAEPGHDTTRLRFLIETIVADDALLEIAPKIPGKDPLRFDIQKLTLRSVVPGHAMAFAAVLTNPKPPGLISSNGTFGPWQRDDPRATPVWGRYTFRNADLGVFNGISGILSSDGNYRGVLQHIEVDGTTDTPNFALKPGGTPVHLSTKFHSIVNGTDGDTILDPVDAHFLHSEFLCYGSVEHRPGENGKTVSLEASTRQGRIEDILKLVLGSEKEFVTGDVNFKSKIVIPPGHEDVLDKLQLDGTFGLLSAEFASKKVQLRIQTLSNRARGISKKEEGTEFPATVASNLRGQFWLKHGIAYFSQLSFDMPGAWISLAGEYKIESEKIDMHGTFQMRATLSQTQSGIKHWLLKPFDPIFAKNGAGFEAPLKITGTKDHPEIEAEIFHKQITIH